jgi:pimeloyl-ACP methyl ester carboxylesterase
MDRMPFAVPVVGGVIGGWVAGSGPPVLLLHGGPGLGFEYLDAMAEEVLTGPYRVASFQQRGLTPSTVEGPFTIAQAVADVEAVLDHLGWSRALLVGHSWGGHLALHVAVSLAERFAGVLAVDPLGGVGDGGAATFGAELLRRVPADRRPAAEALHALDDSEATLEQRVELLGMLWPSYFASPDSAPPMPEVRIAEEASVGLWAELERELPALTVALGGITVRVGVLAGQESPMPPGEAATATAERIPGAWVALEADAGHFPWVERPGCVVAAVDRLAAGVGPT